MSGTIPAELESLDQQPAVLTKGVTLDVSVEPTTAQPATLRKGMDLPVEFVSRDSVPAALAQTLIAGTSSGGGGGSIAPVFTPWPAAQSRGDDGEPGLPGVGVFGAPPPDIQSAPVAWPTPGLRGEEGEPGAPGAFPFFGARPAARFRIDLMDGSQSTKFDSSQKRVVSQSYFNPVLSGWGTSASSTATLYVVLQTTNTGDAAAADFYFEPTVGSPSVIATLPTTVSLTAALLSADVSAYFRPAANAGVFDVRIWITTNNGNDQATITDAFIEVSP